VEVRPPDAGNEDRLWTLYDMASTCTRDSSETMPALLQVYSLASQIGHRSSYCPDPSCIGVDYSRANCSAGVETELRGRFGGKSSADGLTGRKNQPRFAGLSS
jgi:hypothetical protein